MDLHEKWGHRWLTPKAKPFKSNIGGVGLIATERIGKGEFIQVLGGIVVERKDIGDYQKMMGHIGIQIHDDFWLVPADRRELDRTGALNHSCSPSAGFKGFNIYMAIRDIEEGEEIFIDYAFMESFFEPFQCRCGSANCRKIITQDDWKIKGIQEKYGAYFSAYLKERIFSNKNFSYK